MRRPACLALLALLALLVGAARARAEDPVEEARVREAERFLELLATARAAQDKPQLETALGKVVGIHNDLRSRTPRARLREAIGDLLGDEALGALRMTAAAALGRLNDPEEAYQQLRRHLPSVKLEAAGPFPLSVVQAVGALAPDGALPTLERLMEQAKDPNVSRYAIQALGKYGWSKRRTRVLDDLGSFLLKLRPGAAAPGRGRGGGVVARQRYAFLRATLVAALNELTGQTLQDAEPWAALYKDNKRTLDSVFTTSR